MKKFLILDFKRILHSKRVYLSIGVGTLLILLHFIFITHPFAWSKLLEAIFSDMDLSRYEMIGTMYPITWYSEWIGGEAYSLLSTCFFMLIPLLATLPFGDSVTSDHISGYVKNLYCRMDKKYYYQSKFISAFLTGGLVVTIPLCLDILLCSMVRPSLLLMPEASNTFVINGQMFSRLYYRHSFLYVVVYMLIIFIFSGLFAVLGTGIGRYSTNRFIPLVFPFILCLFQSTVVGALQHPEYAIDNFITPAQRVAGITFPVVFAEAVLLFFACVGIYWYGAKKDEAL